MAVWVDAGIGKCASLTKGLPPDTVVRSVDEAIVIVVPCKTFLGFDELDAPLPNQATIVQATNSNQPQYTNTDAAATNTTNNSRTENGITQPGLILPSLLLVGRFCISIVPPAPPHNMRYHQEYGHVARYRRQHGTRYFSSKQLLVTVTRC